MPVMLGYLARYRYRVAITNDRILRVEADQVTFRYLAFWTVLLGAPSDTILL